MKDKSFNLLRWLPVGASGVLMLVIVVVAAASVAELNKATSWRERTFQTILDAQSFEDKLVDAQDSVHDYAGKGQANLLIEYKKDTNSDMQEFNQLVQLTRNDPEQEQRLKTLSAAVQAVFADDTKIIGIYARQGSNAAVQEDEAGQKPGKYYSTRVHCQYEPASGEIRVSLEIREIGHYHHEGNSISFTDWQGGIWTAFFEPVKGQFGYPKCKIVAGDHMD